MPMARSFKPFMSSLLNADICKLALILPLVWAGTV